MVGLRPLLGSAGCRYNPSCGNYAVEQLQKKSVLPALWAIIKRILSCNPFVKQSLQ
ncbi:membrane protein insertion efficiency factor YidD [Candidatus Dependentiae bacterium]|nr:MAG: membrane protein insertion efficiency factor YidD [Candidatus Dependentiae bacterium]